MSVINDDYLYHDYCAAVLPPPMAYGRARELATRLGVPSTMEVCTGLQERICRASVEDGDMACPNASSYDNMVVQCGARTTCVNASKLLNTWKHDPAARAFFSPRHRELVQQTHKRRGTPKARAALTCTERRGNAKLCEMDDRCYTEHPQRAWLDQTTDCKPIDSVNSENARWQLLDLTLRMLPDTISGNMRRRLQANIKALPDDVVYLALRGTVVTTGNKVTAQLNAMSKALLSPEDTLDEKFIANLAQASDIALGPRTVHYLTTVFNAALAALSVQAPWWFYFMFYPSGRSALENILSDRMSGHIFKLSLLMTGMKNNWFFQDKMGLLDYIPVSENPQLQTIVSTLTGVLLRQLSARLEKKGY